MKKLATSLLQSVNVYSKKHSMVLCLIIGLTINSFAQSIPQDLADSLQAILNRSLPIGVQNSGGVISVFVPGQWSWSGASGGAINGMTSGHVATNATNNTKFRVGSISKTFLATAILLLDQQGLLDIEDPINGYVRTTLLDDTIKSSETVKIRHLLNHTSGIDNSAGNMTCQQNALNNLTATYTLEDAIYCGASQGEIFPPEFAWAYSNTNYSILAMILEKVTGMTSMEYIKQNIIIPFGLNDTEIPTTDEISSPHMGCYWNMGSMVDMTIVDPTLYWGWADIVSTSADLNKFYYALLNEDIINNTSLTKMLTMYPGTYDYGLGLDFYTIGANNNAYLGHTGEVGNSSSMWYANNVTTAFPNGYFISYNFNYQGVDMWNVIDEPVYNLMNSFVTSNPSKINLTTEKISVYPNPIKDQLNLDLVGNKTDIGCISIFNFNEQLITKTKVSIEPGKNHFSISTAELANGIYYYEIKSSSINTKGKIVK